MNTELLEKPKLKKTLKEDRKTTSLHLENLPVKGYEQVIKVTDASVGLTAIIAIHSTALGGALGGTRIRPYSTFEEALEDVLRLSKGMTYKSAVAEVGFGGGKSVIIADPKTQKTPELLASFGHAVERLGGKYICAEDSGCTIDDIEIIRQVTKYVVGVSHVKGSGNPSPFTAWGVLRGIQAAAKKLFGSDNLEGKKVAIQGLGSVGGCLVDFLFWLGAELIVSDIDMDRARSLAAKYGIQTVSPEEILKVECDILAPCALGAIINDKTIPSLRCKAIAGAANNQLHKDSHADVLKEKGILYVPDFVINAGGLLNVAEELGEEGYHPRGPRYKTHHLYDTLLAIFEIAEKNKESTHSAALSLAEYRIKYGIGRRVVPPTFHTQA